MASHLQYIKIKMSVLLCLVVLVGLVSNLVLFVGMKVLKTEQCITQKKSYRMRMLIKSK
nr:MAG TPA: hypothetical protein [Caudoviricetes sp.]